MATQYVEHWYFAINISNMAARNKEGYGHDRLVLVHVAKFVMHIFEDHCCGENLRYLVQKLYMWETRRIVWVVSVIMD
jgi:hypothetical protein